MDWEHVIRVIGRVVGIVIREMPPDTNTATLHSATLPDARLSTRPPFILFIDTYAALQSQKAASAYLESKQILHCGFELFWQ